MQQHAQEVEEDPVWGFALRRLVIGPREQIDLTEEEYRGIVRARGVLGAIASFEEKFFALCESYRQLEEFVLKTSLANMVYVPHEIPQMHAVRAEFGRLTSAFLSLARFYIESVLTDADSISEGSIDRESLRRILADRYDTSFHYRLMEAIRNHSQHHAFPVSGVVFQTHANEDHSEVLYSLEFYLDLSRIDENKKFKAAIKEELEARGEKIDMKLCVRSYFQSICDLHIRFRKEFAAHESAASELIARWRAKWKEAFPDSKLLGVAACKLQCGFLDESAERAYLSPQLDEYPEWLKKRTAALANMSKRRVKF